MVKKHKDVALEVLQDMVALYLCFSNIVFFRGLFTKKRENFDILIFQKKSLVGKILLGMNI